MSTPQTLAQVETYWIERLGCSALDLHRPGVTPRPNGGTFSTYQGAFLLRWGTACVFSVPAALLAPTTTAIAGRAVDEVFDTAFLAGIFAGHVERIIGPASQGCADATDFRPVDTRGTRRLAGADGADGADGAALERLARACDPEDWDSASIDRGLSDPTFGCFDGIELVAAGALYAWGPQLRNVHIVTHPAYRGRGYGRAVVSALTAYALAEHHVPQYQTLLNNAGSLAIAHALGYQHYATTLAVRIAG